MRRSVIGLTALCLAGGAETQAEAKTWYALSINGNKCLTMPQLAQEMVSLGSPPAYSPEQVITGLRRLGHTPRIEVKHLQDGDETVSVTFHYNGEEVGRTFFTNMSDCQTEVQALIDSGVTADPSDLQ